MMKLQSGVFLVEIVIYSTTTAFWGIKKYCNQQSKYSAGTGRQVRVT
jgi:hypothetical protein